MPYKMSTKCLWHLKRAPDSIEKTKFGQNVDADHHFELQTNKGLLVFKQRTSALKFNGNVSANL